VSSLETREPFHPPDSIDRQFHGRCERVPRLFPHCAARQNVNVTLPRSACRPAIQQRSASSSTDVASTRAERNVELTGNNRNLQAQAITRCLSAMLRSSKWVRFALAQLGVTCFHPFAFLIA
jgi:hypothetical protein